MNTVIKQIISPLKKGTYFDSHFIISTLIKDYSDDYLEFFAEGGVPESKTTEVFHSKIARSIKAFASPENGQLIEQITSNSAGTQTNPSLSYNIHCKATLCTLWRRL